MIETGQPARGDVRIVYDGHETWYDLSVHPLLDEHGTVTGVIAGAVDVTRYKEQEARIRLLMRELTHRSKNLLTVIQAIMRQTASNCHSVEDFETRFTARLHSLAGSHDLLVQEDWQGASMRELVRSQLGHYSDLDDPQIELTGEPLQIPPMRRSISAWRCTSWRPTLPNTARCQRRPANTDFLVHVSWRRMARQCANCRGRSPEVPPSSRRRAADWPCRHRTHGCARPARRGQYRLRPPGLRWTLEFPRSLISHA